MSAASGHWGSGDGGGEGRAGKLLKKGQKGDSEFFKKKLGIKKKFGKAN